MKNWELAKKDYLAGMKYKDIATKYKVSVNTVKSWKSRHGWIRGAPAKKSMHPKSKKVAPKIVDELDENTELTEKQKKFCLYYLQRFNATWAYKKAYECKYDVAATNGPRMLRNAQVKSLLDILKKQLHADAYVTIDDLINEYAKQAFANLGSVLDYKVHKEIVSDKNGLTLFDMQGNPVEKHVTDIYLKPSDEIDWSTVKSIHQGKDGLVVEMYDKQKALDSLLKYFKDDKDVSKAKSRKVNAEADIAQAKAAELSNGTDQQMKSIDKLLSTITEEVKNDGKSS